MKLTEELIEHIEELEGFKDEAYYDVNNNLTIGFGHTQATETFDFVEGQTIDREKAIEVLQLDLEHAEGVVKNLIKNSPNVSIEDFTQDELSYAVLVYFNRPWALRNVQGERGTYDGLELIARGNLDDVIADQEAKFNRKYDNEIPEWATNRLTKEKSFTTFDTPPDDDTPPPDDDTPPENKEVLYEYTSYGVGPGFQSLGGELKQKHSIFNPQTKERQFFDTNLTKEQQDKIDSEKEDTIGNDFTRFFKSLGDTIKERFSISGAIDKQIDFMEKTYSRKEAD